MSTISLVPIDITFVISMGKLLVTHKINPTPSLYLVITHPLINDQCIFVFKKLDYFKSKHNIICFTNLLLSATTVVNQKMFSLILAPPPKQQVIFFVVFTYI